MIQLPPSLPSKLPLVTLPGGQWPKEGERESADCSLMTLPASRLRGETSAVALRVITMACLQWLML